MSENIPVTVLTGFLGSGKTTLLNRLLSDPRGMRAAVLINEFGEIGLDHLLARNIEGTKVVISNGCICCTVHEDLRNTLRTLLDARGKGEIPSFDHLLVETSGASDPLPVLLTLRGDALFRHHFRINSIVTAIDAVNGITQLQRPTAQRQAALADVIAVTKTDLQPDTVSLFSRLTILNPEALIIDAQNQDDLWQTLMQPPRKLNSPVSEKLFRSVSTHESGTGIQSFSLVFDGIPDRMRFSMWLSLLMHRYGTQILRIKGLLKITEEEPPLLLNVVQNFIHPPVHLSEWPDSDRRSRLVFIMENIDPEKIKTALKKVLSADA